MLSSLLNYDTSPGQEIVDLLARANDTRIYHTSATEPGELDAYSNDDKNSKLQVPRARVVPRFFLCFCFSHRLYCVVSPVNCTLSKRSFRICIFGNGFSNKILKFIYTKR